MREEEHEGVEFEPLQPGQGFCVGVANTEGVCPGMAATVVGCWWQEGDPTPRTAKWTGSKLSTRSLCSGELAIDDQCLRLWDG